MVRSVARRMGAAGGSSLHLLKEPACHSVSLSVWPGVTGEEGLSIISKRSFRLLDPLECPPVLGGSLALKSCRNTKNTKSPLLFIQALHPHPTQPSLTVTLIRKD